MEIPQRFKFTYTFTDYPPHLLNVVNGWKFVLNACLAIILNVRLLHFVG